MLTEISDNKAIPQSQTIDGRFILSLDNCN